MPPRKEYPNAEWAGWIKEVANQATDKNSRVSETYCKAAKAIKFHPVKLNHPKDALSLPGVGPKVVKIISDRLEKWCQENQALYPPQVPLNKDKALPDLESDGLPQPTASTSQIHKPAPRPKKTYQPKPRDPAWGILAAMYSICELTDLKKFSSREVIVDRAARYSDFAYVDVREDNATRYASCWNKGITALIKHGLVIFHTTLRPMKYALTRIGYELAAIIALEEGIPLLDVELQPLTPHDRQTLQSNSGASVAPLHLPTTSNNVQTDRQRLQLVSNSKSFAAPSKPDIVSSKGYQQLFDTIRNAAPVVPLPFQFYYINTANCRVQHLIEAATRSDPVSKESYYKIEYHSNHQSHRFPCKHVMIDEKDAPHTGQDTMFGWLKSDKTTPTCPGFSSVSAPKRSDCQTSGAPHTRLPLASASSLTSQLSEACPPPLPDMCPLQRPMQAALPSDHCPNSQISGSSSRAVGPKSYQHKSGPYDKPRARASFATADHAPLSIPKPRASIGSIASVAHQVQAEVWKAKSYSIVLIIDNREVQSQSNRDGIFQACLTRAREIMGPKGKVQQRPLPVGDALWIAIHNQTGKEAVLDSIVERKRLDDLCKSITDARFHEQKARIKNSGLKDRIYLIESYYSHNNRDQYEQQIQTSQVELMLLDNYHLQVTDDWNESVDYLVIRTNVLNQLHEKIDLSVIPDKHIDRSSYLSLLQELRQTRPSGNWVTSYDVYESLNSKSGNFTVQELWGRMIHQLSGMSIEKVAEFVDRWPTPRAFTQEFYHQQRAARAGAQPSAAPPIDRLSKWLEDQLCGDKTTSRQKLGPVLSRKLSELFSLPKY